MAELLIAKDCYMSTIDLQDAHFLIPIHESFRKYLRFNFQSFLYEFTCLPFGLCSSPYVYTKLLKPIMSHLRARGITAVIYLDDFLCVGSSKTECKDNVECTIRLLQKLGFAINYRKSELTPSQERKYLGLIFNSRKCETSLTPESKKSISNLLQTVLRKKLLKIHNLASLIGKLIFASQGVEYGLLHTRDLERIKIKALEKSKGNFNTMTSVPASITPEIQWWLDNLNLHKKLKTGKFVAEIFTDASDSGWGATDGYTETYGHWTEEERLWHINFKELMAVKLALHNLASNLSKCQILLRVDNTTAICYINRMGGVKFISYNNLAKEIWNWAQDRQIFLTASYIPSSENASADKLSRIKNIDTEWSLSLKSFRKIVDTFGHPQIDLFASKINAKCKKFVSWFPDPEAEKIDAFTLDWSKWFFYAFPPFSMMLRVLSKIKRDGATGIIVAPHWPTQIWFPLLSKLLVSKVLFLKPNPHLLNAFSNQHPQSATLTLMAGVVCENLS